MASGKFVVHVPPVLHQELIEAAKREGVSLNQLCLYILSRNTGRIEVVEAVVSEFLSRAFKPEEKKPKEKRKKGN